MALSKSLTTQILPSSISIFHEPYIQHKRYFAKAKKEKNQSTLSQLRSDKTTQQYAEILSWWNKTKTSRLDLSRISPEIRSEFIQKREIYKESNINRINKMKESIMISTKRKEEAMDALPARLSFICKITKEPKWKTDLAATVKNTYYNLHHTAKTNPSSISSLNLDDNKYYDINKLRHKERDEIEILEEERMNNMKQYKFAISPLEYFPPLYDPGDIRTQPAYVRSYFDYTWKPGIDIPVKQKKSTIDPDAHLNHDEKEQIYGHDYSQIQLAKIVNVESAGGSGIGGTEDLKRKLQAEEEASLSEKQKLQKERGKKTAEARAKDNLRLEKIRKAKEKIKQSIKDWEKHLKTTTTTNDDDQQDNDDDDDDDNHDIHDDDHDDDDDNDNDKQHDAIKRIEELEILNQDLPKLESLLVDKDLNKQFFEKTLPLMLNHELIDDDKKEECIMLIRKYHTLQTHVGYGVK